MRFWVVLFSFSVFHFARGAPPPKGDSVSHLGVQESPPKPASNAIDELAQEAQVQPQPVLAEVQQGNPQVKDVEDEPAPAARQNAFRPKYAHRPPSDPNVRRVDVSPAVDGTMSLAQNPHCAKDIKQFCGSVDANMNNLNILECFQNIRENANESLSPECLHQAWVVKFNFTKSDTFLKAADSLCVGEFEQLPCQGVRSGRNGEFLACVIEHRDQIKRLPCKQFLIKLEALIFSDFHLISGFIDACGTNIEALKCGRIHGDPQMSSQKDTIQCLTQNFEKLGQDCQHRLLRVGELQGEDFHLDRALFFACRDDREILCRDVPSGDGRVYSCLLRFKNDPRMSEVCQKEIYRREQLVQKDYTVSHGLAKVCKDDIKKYQCRTKPKSTGRREVRLARILLCLEEAMSDGNPVSGPCQAEILEHRRALLEPMGLSPELVVACETDIHDVCNKDERFKGRPTLECLMDLAAPSKHDFNKDHMITDTCLREVEGLLKEVNAGEDWRVDPFVRESCQSVVSTACRDVVPGEGRVIQCLMRSLGTPAMTADCEESLLRLMYFVSRDFELDPKLYRSCKGDARLHCNAKQRWAGEPGTFEPEPGLVVLACLYHITVHPEDGKKLDHKCEEEVRHVMLSRGKRVDLHPEIEEYCLSDLAAFCSGNVQPGQEILCLQDNIQRLSKDCREKIIELTVDEDRHAEDNPYIMEHCLGVAKEYCAELMNAEAEEEDLFECLVEHKPEIGESNPKCYAAITHFQLITLENVKFSRKFEKACAEDIDKFCYDSNSDHPNKPKRTDEIIECLSEIALEEALGESQKGETLHPRCKKQLMNQLRHEEENVEINPRVKKACGGEITQFCARVEPGGGKIIECLKEHFAELGQQCKDFIFRGDAIAMREDRVDFSLTEHCHGMIVKYKCVHKPLECLKKFKDESDFDENCHLIIVRRMIEQSYDFRMNPELQNACNLDIGKFCAKHLVGHKGKAPKILEGEVLSCLRDTLASKPHKLTDTCKHQIEDVVENAAKDVRQNPHLTKVCKHAIKELCPDKGPGEVEECLKAALLSGDSSKNGIKDEKCKQEIVNIIAAEETDIHLDPILFGSCVAHIPVACPGVPRGEGRQLKCLLGVLASNPSSLSIECREKLKSRKAMFAYADSHVVKPPESLVELKDVVMHSPASNFFILFILGVAFFVFFGGLLFGRATKQLREELKNK